MADYSGFKIKRPHSLAPLTSVYEAEALDGRPGRFALKIFHPPASTNVRRVHAIEGWLLAAERQQLSAKKDGTVLEVVAFGRCEEGAFAVYPWQERFLEPLIKTLGAKGNTLRALAECLLATIEKWETQTGGPHGNLKPSNVFLDRTGPLVGMTAKLSDPAYLPGAKIEALRQADLAAVGAMLATIVRRRPPGAWPIEEAPEWKALGKAGKGWLDYCNFLLNPQPNEGEVTLASARLRLKKVPKDANPVKTAGLSLAAALVLGAVSVLGFARFGNYNSMPDQFQRLAQTVGNPSVPKVVPAAWAQLCAAWDTWLVDMQSNGGRLLRTKDLFDANDELRKALADFMKDPTALRPESLVPQAEGEKRLGVLGTAPPEAVFNELLLTSTVEKVTTAFKIISDLNKRLEDWSRWEQLRTLQQLMADRQYTQVAEALAARLPPARGSVEYGKQNVVRTLKFFNDLSLDAGALPLASRWSAISQISAEMTATTDRVQKEMPRIILNRLEDKSSISDFADSLESPLEEMRLRRKQYSDPEVVRERFLAESPLQTETAEVTAEDIPKWEQELVAFSKVPKAENPSQPPAPDATFIDATATQMTREAVDLEREAPEGEAGQPVTLNTDDFNRELTGLTANLTALRAKTIVRRDLPKVSEDTTKLKGVFQQLLGRLTYTLSLLKPETWLTKVKLPYGTFTESKQRWEAWAEPVRTVDPNSLKGAPANRTRFRQLREKERNIKGWIDGLEGPTGFGALKVPDLAGTASAVTAAELKRLEAVLRDRAATAVGTATGWGWSSEGLPAIRWDRATEGMRLPLDKHSEWLGQLAYFAGNLDQLSEHLTNGMEWKEGVSEMFFLLEKRTGVEELAGAPATWYAEAKQLQQLDKTSDLAALKAAAESGRLSGKLMAWRKLGSLDGWPASAGDFDLDVGVIGRMREFVGRDVKDADRKARLFEEMVTGTKLRFNRAARAATRDGARVAAQLTDMYNRMQGAGVKETDLDEGVAYNLAAWRLKQADRNEKNNERWRVRRDAFVTAVQALPGIKEQPGVSEFVKEIAAIDLKDDPNRVPTPSPAAVGWAEEPVNEGLSLIATWKSGTRTVQLPYHIVLPQDGTPPFFLAERAVAVGEFVDLLAGGAKGADTVLKAMPAWTQDEKAYVTSKPYNTPISWRPRPDFKGLEVNAKSLVNPNARWIHAPNAMVIGLLDNPVARAASREVEQAAVEEPTRSSPLQMIPADVAKLFTEKVLGARLPTPREWQAVLQVEGPAPKPYLRGQNFQKLWSYVENYHEGGQTWDWRPNEGIFLPMVAGPGSNPGATVRRKYVDDGQGSATADASNLWFRPVNEGSRSGKFINLTGNVSIFLAGDKPSEFYVAGGSVLSPPGIDFTQPHKIEGTSLIGQRGGSEVYSDVGIRPAFDAPPGFKERYKLLMLVKDQRYLTL